MSVERNRADTFSVAHYLWVARFENAANFLKRKENRKKRKRTKKKKILDVSDSSILKV